MQNVGGVSVVCCEQGETRGECVCEYSVGVSARGDLYGLGVVFDGVFPVVEACLS